MHNHILISSKISTPIGDVIAISDDQSLLMLEFADRKNLASQIENLKLHFQTDISSGIAEPLKSVEQELKCYFDGSLKSFKTAIRLIGTDFQNQVWQSLQEIPYGQTISYSQLATCVHRPSAQRAVANANSRNKLAIIVPCHRVINSNSNLCGYAGGVDRKRWLIEHEKLIA